MHDTTIISTFVPLFHKESIGRVSRPASEPPSPTMSRSSTPVHSDGEDDEDDVDSEEEREELGHSASGSRASTPNRLDT